MEPEANNLLDQGYQVQGGAIYAPADFTDAQGNDGRPLGSVASTVNNVSLYHMSDANEKAQMARAWKKKIREIMQNHQERIIRFITTPLPTDHPLKVARSLIQKYGRNANITYDIHKPTPQFMKDFVVDLSGTGIAEINTYIGSLELARSADQPLQRLSNITRSLLDYMRDVGDELIRLDQALQNECNHLDVVVDKVAQLMSVDPPELEGFNAMMEQYIQKQFEKHPIEKLYWDYINSVQKYLSLRDILTSQRLMSVNEPLCCVCMMEAVVIAFSPCGHTFCGNCAKRALTCYVCRGAVQNRVKLYFT